LNCTSGKDKSFDITNSFYLNKDSIEIIEFNNDKIIRFFFKDSLSVNLNINDVIFLDKTKGSLKLMLNDALIYKKLELNTAEIDLESSKYWTVRYKGKGQEWYSFFNDGNALSEFDKKVGETGGLYFAPAYKTRKVVTAFKTSMRKGLGGEIPENDVEAVLKSLEKYPDAEHAILVADNSPFRDFELVDKIKAPVHVILQGAEWGINPQYINLAYLTGGSLHTLKKDYDADFFAKGDTLINIDGYEFSLNKIHNLYQCNNRRICEDLEATINRKEAEILAELKTKSGYRGMHKDKKTKGFNKFIHWLFGG